MAVHVVADDQGVREAISRAMTGCAAIEIAGSLPLEAARELFRRHPPDAVVAVATDEVWASAVSEMADRHEDALVILIVSEVDWPTEDVEAPNVDHIERAGPERIASVLPPLIATAMRDESVALRPAPALAADDEARLAQLTPREREILALTAEGLTIERTAKRIHRSAATVAKHRDNIMKKTHLNDRVALTRFAIRVGLTTP